jgi:hypothetical protein
MPFAMDNLLIFEPYLNSKDKCIYPIINGCLVFCCISACIYVVVFSCIFLLFFVGFIFLLFCMGYSFHLVLGLIFVVETLAILWFFALHALQLSFYNGSCFTRIGFFIEFLYNLHRVRL